MFQTYGHACFFRKGSRRRLPKQRRAQGEDAGFATLVEQLPALIQMADPDGRFIYFNQRWLEYIGADLDDVTGWN